MALAVYVGFAVYSRAMENFSLAVFGVYDRVLAGALPAGRGGGRQFFRPFFNMDVACLALAALLFLLSELRGRRAVPAQNGVQIKCSSPPD